MERYSVNVNDLTNKNWGGSPDLVVIGSRLMFQRLSSNSGTEYWMDIFHIPICCKNCNVCLKRRK